MRKTNKLPTQQELFDLFNLDSLTGVLYWRERIDNKRWNTRFAGQVAGTKSNGYIQIRINGKHYYAHRIIFKMVHGSEPSEVDHIDHDTVNNAVKNLRDGSKSVNAKNKVLLSNNKTGKHGIYRKPDNTEGYIVKISSKYVGSFDTWEDAIEARNLAEKEQGFHTNHGST